MKVNIIGRQMNVWNEMKETIEQKLGKLDKYFNDEAAATVTLSSKRNQKCLEITINASGFIFRNGCSNRCGVRPACILKSNIFVSKESK